MNDENFRKLLIYLLKNYKIYYQDVTGKYQEYYEIDKYTNEMLKSLSDIKNVMSEKKNDNYRYINSYGKINAHDIEIPNINYKALLLEKKQKLKELLKVKTFNIEYDYSLEQIAEELSKIGDYEEFDSIYKNSKLLELREILNKDTKVILKYIQDNSNKKIG